MKITRYTVDTPMSIVFLSDLHNSPFEPVTAETAKLKPDIIAVTGDFIYGHKIPQDTDSILLTQKNVLPFLKGCAELAPTFVSFGNHEWRLTEHDTDLIKNTGAVLLDNEYISLDGVVIGGLTSASKTGYDSMGIRDRYPDEEEKRLFYYKEDTFIPNTNWLNDFTRQKGFKILLSHHPEYYDKYLSVYDNDIDLVLSGHCHGGQIRLFGRGLFAPNQGILPKLTKGVYKKMIISAGLSNTAKPIPRLFNPREIVYINRDRA